MQKPENIVAKWTRVLSNRMCESSMGKAPVLERGGHTEGHASNRAIVMENELCSIVKCPTRIWFEWINVCDEPFECWRNQHLWTSLGKCIQRTLRCMEDSTVARIDGQTGKFHAQRWSLGECMIPTSWIVHGMADVVVVAMMPGITSRKIKGPLGMVAWRKRGHRILPERAIRSGIWGSESISKCMWISNLKGEVHLKPEGKEMHDRWTPCLKPYGRKAPVRNFRGLGGNGS